MRFVFLLVLTACGSDPSTGGDATTSDAGEDCGATFYCCSACDDDALRKAICVDGKRACPAGLTPQSELVCPCYPAACSLPPPPCVACDGGETQQTCDVDANVFRCPAGMHSMDDLDASCE